MCSNSDVIFESYENQIMYDCHNSLGFGCGVCWDMYYGHVCDVFVREGIVPRPSQYNHID